MQALVAPLTHVKLVIKMELLQKYKNSWSRQALLAPFTDVVVVIKMELGRRKK